MMSGGPSLKAKIVNFRLMPSLIAATLASEKPTDGYLVNDILKMSFESQQVRLFLQEYLMGQLVSSRNVYVKIKVLKLFIELAGNGHPEFRQNLLKQYIPINDASKLRGTNPDLAGDVGRIRDLAKKLLDMLYDESITVTPPTTSRGNSQEQSSRSDPSKYKGFGNTATTESSRTTNKSFLSGGLFTRKQQSETVSYDPDYASMKPVLQNMDQNNVIRVMSSSSRPNYAQGPIQHGDEHVRGEAGGGWKEEKTVEQTENTRFQPAGEERSTTVATADGGSDEEQRLVDTITAPGGVRAAPARDQLDQFIKKCKALDVLVITDLLKDKLRSESQQVVLRTLFVLEAMLRSDIPSVESCLDLTLDELSVLCQSQQASIKSKACKLMKQLGATASSSSGSTIATTGGTMATAPSNATGNILDLDTPSVANSNGPSEQPHPTASMFEGLSVTSSNSVAPSTSDNSNKFTSLFGEMSIQPPSTSSAQPLGEDDDDGLIDLGEEDDSFDPLVRTSSFGSRTGSLLRSSSTSSQSAFAFLKQSSVKGEELPLSGDLFGAPPTTDVQQQQQLGMAAHTTRPPLMGMNMMSSYNMSGAVNNQQQMTYPTSQHLAQQVTSYHTQMPLLGNSARPVQLASKTSQEEELSDSFSFLGKKATKANAFDFVQDEMKARMKNS